MKKYDSIYGMTLLIISQAMVGLNIVISKLLVASIPILVLLEIRFGLATFILLLLHWLSPARQQPIKHYFSQLRLRDWGYILAEALTAGVLFNCFMVAGLQYTDANVAGIITSVLPAMIAILSWLFLKEKMSFQKILCIAFATVGLVIIGSEKLHGTNISHSFLGDSLIFISLLPEAAYYILCKRYNNRLPLFLIAALMNGINALVLFFPVVFSAHFETFNLWNSSGLILLLIGLSTGFFYVFWFMGAQRIEGTLASLSTATMPIMTIILAYLILHEHISIMQMVGMGLVILSIVLYARR